jgi:hypothetical protein
VTASRKICDTTRAYGGATKVMPTPKGLEISVFGL